MSKLTDVVHVLSHKRVVGRLVALLGALLGLATLLGVLSPQIAGGIVASASALGAVVIEIHSAMLSFGLHSHPTDSPD